MTGPPLRSVTGDGVPRETRAAARAAPDPSAPLDELIAAARFVLDIRAEYPIDSIAVQLAMRRLEISLVKYEETPTADEGEASPMPWAFAAMLAAGLFFWAIATYGFARAFGWIQ